MKSKVRFLVLLSVLIPLSGCGEQASLVSSDTSSSSSLVSSYPSSVSSAPSSSSSKVSSEETSSSVSSSAVIEDHHASEYKKTLPYKDNFRILWLTDTHFGAPVNCPGFDADIEYAHLDKMIKAASNPDLIVFTGDIFENETEEQVDTFFTTIDAYNIPFAFTYGNHDLASLKGDPFYINRKLMACTNSVFVDYENDSIDGYSNYYINLTKDNKTSYRLYLIDTNDLKPADAKGDTFDDIIHANQLDHVKAISTYENDSAPSLLFYHIPLREVAKAYVGYTANPQIYQGRGEKRDNYGFGYKESGAYEVFKDVGVIGAFSGHTHINDYDIDYFDDVNHMVLSSGLKATDLNYHDEDLIGYKIITLPSSASEFTHANIVEYKVSY